jgi:hypothetical protein
MINKKIIDDKRINIIYYIWINKDRNWHDIIEGQLNDLKNSEILSVSKLYIILCAENNQLITDATYLIFSSLNYVENLTLDFITTLDNKYEYYGIKKIYDLANNEPHKYYVYLHSKGMYHLNINNLSRFSDEITLTRTLINSWKSIIKILDNNKLIMKVGLLPALGGWLWFNFFWVKGIYVRSCEEPRITNDRYYYESWLATTIMAEFYSYSIYEGKIKRYDGTEASNIITNLRGKY